MVHVIIATALDSSSRRKTTAFGPCPDDWRALLVSKGWRHIGAGRYAKSVDGVEWRATNSEIFELRPLEDLP